LPSYFHKNDYKNRSHVAIQLIITGPPTHSVGSRLVAGVCRRL